VIVQMPEQVKESALHLDLMKKEMGPWPRNRLKRG
jgi:hypothetical protein